MQNDTQALNQLLMLMTKSGIFTKMKIFDMVESNYRNRNYIISYSKICTIAWYNVLTTMRRKICSKCMHIVAKLLNHALLSIPKATSIAMGKFLKSSHINATTHAQISRQKSRNLVKITSLPTLSN